MSLTPTGLDWWQWLLAALVCWGLAWFFVSRREGGGGFSTVLGWVGGLLGAYCAGAGILQLVRWVMDTTNR